MWYRTLAYTMLEGWFRGSVKDGFITCHAFTTAIREVVLLPFDSKTREPYNPKNEDEILMPTLKFYILDGQHNISAQKKSLRMRSIKIFMIDVIIEMLDFYVHEFLQNILLDYESNKILRTRNLLILHSLIRWSLQGNI